MGHSISSFFHIFSHQKSSISFTSYPVHRTIRESCFMKEDVHTKGVSIMSKRQFRLLLVTALGILLTVSGLALAQNSEMAPLNPEFLEYREQLNSAENATTPFYGYIPPTVDLSHLQGPIFEGLHIAAYPSTYDLRNVSGVSYVTSVRNQDPFGTCWAFGTMGSLESTTLRNKQGVSAAAEPDYSEWHLAYFVYTDQTSLLLSFTPDTVAPGDNPTFDPGGNVFQSTAMLSRWTGAVNETDCPYWNTDKNPPASELPTGSESNARVVTSVLFLGSSSTTSFTQDDIKYALTNYGACAIRYCVAGNGMSSTASDAYWNHTTYSYYMDSAASSGGHIVTIVGWDDTYAAANFSTAPPGPGAWIVKNSWGTSWGDSGYFYLSYYDANIGYPAVFLGNDTTTFNYVYQYDFLGWVSNRGYGSTSAYFANVFTVGDNFSASEAPGSAAAGEALKAVSFYASTSNASYEIRVYTGVTGNPTSGTLVFGPQAGVLTAPGYYTIPLTTEIPLTAGDKFAVSVKLTTPGYNFPIPVENLETGYTDNARAHAGEGYISSNGAAWTDLTTIAGQEDSSVALKAFSVNYTGPTITPTGTPTTTPTGSPTAIPTVAPTGSGSGGGGGCSLGFVPLGLLFLLPLLVLKK